jgi:ABC-type microcin C transport system permease subunit YejB
VNRAGDQTQAEYYQLIKGQIEHHDNLVNQRVIWQIISQSFFFSAYPALLNAPKEAKNALFEAGQSLFMWMLPITGLSAGILTYASIMASMKTIEHLQKLYTDYARSRPEDDSTKLFPHIQGPAHLLKWANLSPTWMPIVFTAAWLLVLGRLIYAALL